VFSPQKRIGEKKKWTGGAGGGVQMEIACQGHGVRMAIRQSVRRRGSAVLLVTRDRGVVPHLTILVVIRYDNTLSGADRQESQANGCRKLMSIECRNISFTYPGTEKVILNDISFSIDSPGFIGLFGPSGVGKTSIAKIMAGLYSDHRGEVHHTGSGPILYSYNTERLPGWSSIRNHLVKTSSPETEQERDELVSICGLEHVMESRFSQLSLGQQNRINLIRYLLQPFDILIMDEILANVDEATRSSIILDMKKRYPQKTFVYISHNVVEVSRFCKEIFVLRGAGKSPAVQAVQGLDATGDRDPDRSALELTMLEIMNAS
jgi:ABC-type nitrate/sulfonate/bicarbonate transport system ATPase subunit